MNILFRVLGNRYLLLAVLALSAFLIRYRYIDPQRFLKVGGGDQIAYIQIAESLTRDHEMRMEPGLRSFFPPLHPCILALISQTVGQSLRAFYLFYFGVSALTVLVFFYLGRRLTSDVGGVIAAGMVVVYEEFIFWTTHIYTETPFMFFLLLTLLSVLRAMDGKGNREVVMTAFLFALTFYVRSTILVLYPFVLLHWYVNMPSWRLFLRRAAVFSVALALFFLPWVVRNYLVHDAFVLGSTNGGMNLYQGNNDEATGGMMWPSTFKEPNYWQYPALTEVAQDRYLYATARQWIFADPSRFLRLAGKKLRLLWSFGVDEKSYPGEVSSTHPSPLLHWKHAVMVLGSIGFLLTLPQWRRWLVAYGVVVITVFTNVVFYAAHRYRLPLDAMFLLWSAHALFIGLRTIMRWSIGQDLASVSLPPTVGSLSAGIRSLVQRAGLCAYLAFPAALLVGAALMWAVPALSMRHALNAGAECVIDPRAARHGPSKFEATTLFFPWGSYLRQTWWLSRGTYELMLAGYGAQSRGYPATLTVSVNGQLLGKVVLSDQLTRAPFRFTHPGGLVRLSIVFDRSAEELAWLFPYTLRKVPGQP